MNYVPNTQTTLWLAPITRSGVVVAATGLSLRIVEGERRAIHISSSPSSVLPPSSCPFIPSMYFIRQETHSSVASTTDRQRERLIGLPPSFLPPSALRPSSGVTDGRTSDGREEWKARRERSLSRIAIQSAEDKLLVVRIAPSRNLFRFHELQRGRIQDGCPPALTGPPSTVRLKAARKGRMGKATRRSLPLLPLLQTMFWPRVPHSRGRH